MSKSIKARLGSIDDKSQQKDLVVLFNAAQADLTALRAAFVALTAKLDADATIAATDFGSTTNPVANTLLK